jgi:tetratricopeptide (TPR) repeat protein
LDKKDYNRAIEYFKKALEISERYGDYHGNGKRMLNLGSSYIIIKDFEKAYFTFLRGLKGFKRLEINTGKELD